MLELTNLKSNNTDFERIEISLEDQQNITGGAAGYLSGGTATGLGLNAGRLAGTGLGVLAGSYASRRLGFNTDFQRATSAIGGGLGALAGGASLAE